MWICSHCRQDSEDEFAVCWNCGSTRDGVAEEPVDAVDHSPPIPSFLQTERSSARQNHRQPTSRTRQIFKSLLCTLIGAGACCLFAGHGATQIVIVATLGAFVGFALSLPGVSAGNVAAGTLGMIIAHNIPGPAGRRVFDALTESEGEASDFPRGDEVLLHGNPDEVWKYAYDTKRCVVVDWRADEESIVSDVASKLPAGELEWEWIDAAELSLVLRFRERRMQCTLALSPRDRYLVLRSLNRVLAGDYELRPFTCTFETDTHSFLLRQADWWAEWERRFPDRFDELFSRITDETDFM